MPGIDLEFAVELQRYLRKEGWPVNEITEILLVGRRGDEWSFQLVSAYPTSATLVDDYILDLAKALAKALEDANA